MNKNNLIHTLKTLNLESGDYLIFGGACLAVRDIRTTKDIDVFVTPEVYEMFKARGWEEDTETWEHPWLRTFVDGIEIEVYQHIDTEGWQARFEDCLAEPEIIEGYRFMPLNELYQWKASMRRLKDIKDIELIDAYRKGV